MAVAAVAVAGLVQRPAFSEGTLTPLPIRRRVLKLAALGGAGASAGSWQKRRGRRRRASPKQQSAKRVDPEFDLVIIPADGISMSGSESDVSDWSVGWFEPHHSSFLADNELEDSFAVLVPCYGSPSPHSGAASKPLFPSSDDQHPPPWAAVLANLAKRTDEDNKRHLENWLACL